MFPVGREALEVLARGLVHGGVAHAQLLEEPLGLHDLLGQRLRLRLVPLRPLVPLLLDVVPIGDLTKRIVQHEGNLSYIQRSPLFCANIVKKDPGRVRQSSLATAGTNFT